MFFFLETDYDQLLFLNKSDLCISASEAMKKLSELNTLEARKPENDDFFHIIGQIRPGFYGTM